MGSLKKFESNIRSNIYNNFDFFYESHAIMLIIDPETQRIINVNRAACNFYGFSREELVRLKISDINMLSDEEIYDEIMKAKDNEKYYFNFRHKISNGEIKDVEVYSGPLNIDGEELLLSIIHDVSEKKEIEKEYYIQGVYLKELFNNSPEAIMVLDNDFNILDVNRKFENMFEYSCEDVKGMDITKLLCTDEFFEESYYLTNKIKEGTIVRKETKRKKSDGRLVDVMLFGYPIISNGEQLGIYLIYTDITDEKQKDNELEYLAIRDKLTGLYNKEYLIDKLNYEINKSKAKGIDSDEKLCLLFIDISSLNDINNTLGYFEGDRIIYLASKRIKKILDERGILARLNGGEFIILIPNIGDKEDMLKLVNYVLMEFESPFTVNDKKILISISVGISIFPDDSNDAISLIRNAHISKNKAKLKRGNNFEFYSPELNNKANEVFLIQNSLSFALDRNEFNLNYQPIIDTTTKKIIGAEALIRWNSKELGAVSPAIFIPIAEESGFMPRIGEWVLMTACAQAKTWHDMGYKDMYISVNISPKQLERPEYPKIVKEILKDTGLDPKYLELEITETAYMENIKDTLDVLKQISDLGVRFSIDDFGTGYSSLSQLSILDLSKLKIDRSFINHINKNKNNDKIISAIISMAKNLNLLVVAEGVETLEQADFLKVNCCDLLQGYLFGKPVDHKHFERLLLGGVVW